VVRVVTSLALSLGLLGCASAAPLGESVVLLTVETQTGPGCVLDPFYVSDVIADPTSGAPTDAATGEQFAWPKGFTARRAGSEVAVLDPAGAVVLATGRRYWMCPATDPRESGGAGAARSRDGGWVIGSVKPCPDCELGGYGWPFARVDCTANPTHSTCLPHERPGGPSPTPPQPPP
jgi:hypothetical protein